MGLVNELKNVEIKEQNTLYDLLVATYKAGLADVSSEEQDEAKEEDILCNLHEIRRRIDKLTEVFPEMSYTCIHSLRDDARAALAKDDAMNDEVAAALARAREQKKDIDAWLKKAPLSSAELKEVKGSDLYAEWEFITYPEGL